MATARSAQLASPLAAGCTASGCGGSAITVGRPGQILVDAGGPLVVRSRDALRGLVLVQEPPVHHDLRASETLNPKPSMHQGR